MKKQPFEGEALSPHEIHAQLLRRRADLKEELVVSDVPVYAVLDGAMFDRLPTSLFDAGLAARPLYSDRGGLARDFDLTAPQLVWLDRWRAQGETAPSEAPAPAVIERLWSLLGETAAGVFWDCESGFEATFHHLRGLGKVAVPAEAMMADRQPDAGGADEIVLFRHADPNVLAQVVPALDEARLGRIMGPTRRLRFVPEAAWALGETYDILGPQAGAVPRGMLRFDATTMDRVEARRSLGILGNLLISLGARFASLGPRFQETIENGYSRARSYGLERLEDIELFVETECEFGPNFEMVEGRERARSVLRSKTKSAPERVYYAREVCLPIREGHA